MCDALFVCLYVHLSFGFMYFWGVVVFVGGGGGGGGSDLIFIQGETGSVFKMSLTFAE